MTNNRNTDPRADAAEGGHLTGWRLSAGDEHLVFDGRSRRLACVPVGGVTGRTFKEGADCARLIAAAPELVEALRAMVDLCERDGWSWPEPVVDARALLARIEGRDA